MSLIPSRTGRRRFASHLARKPLGQRRTRTLLMLEDLEDRTLPTLLGQQLFPSDYPLHQNISDASVAANSAAVIAHIGPSIGIHPDWGTDSASNGNAPLYGIPYNVVHGNSIAKVNVVIDNYPSQSDIIPVPIPANAVIEGDYQDGPNPNGAGYNPGQRGDSHLIIWDEDSDTAYELFGVSRPSDPTLFPNADDVELPHTDGLWHAAQETVWHMTADQFRELGETSADAAGLSILAGLARPEEGLPVSQGGQGAIDHALRFTLPAGDVLSQYIYPASHMVDASSASDDLPLGARLRLENTPAIDQAISEMGPEAQIIATAMQQYGLILADIGSPMFVTGSSASENASGAIDLTWDMNDVLGLEALTASDFQVVNLTPVVTGLSDSSGAAGTTITITGQNFSGSAGHLSVFFGSVAASTVAYVDDGHITAVVPAGTGTVNVTVQSGVNETDTISDSPSANVNAPIFGYGTSATSANDLFTFSAALPATHLSTSAPTDVAAGTVFSLTVTALDADDETAVGFGGIIHFTSTDPLAILPPDYTFEPGDFGAHTFQIIAGTAGNQTFTVSDTPDGLGSAESAVDVTPGPVSMSESSVTAAPTTVQAGRTSTFTLTARDAYGNQETSGGLTILFGLSGAGGGTFGPVTDNRNGTYTVVFTATTAGTDTITATIGLDAVTSRAPTLTISADVAPVIQPIAPISLPDTQFPDTVAVDATSPVNNPLTYSVVTEGDSLLYDVQSQYQFTGMGYYSVGAAAYVLHSNQPGPGVGGYYLLRPSDGAIFPYDSTGNYGHAYANGTSIATLGADVYTDPTLLLNAQPPAEYTTLQALEAQFQFTGVGYFNAGGAAYVLSSPTLNSFHNQYYLIRPSDGEIFAYDGSGSYAHSFASSSPIATLGPNLYAYPDELTDSQASPSLYAQLYQVESQLDLHEQGGSYDTNFFGNQAEWLYSPVLNQYGEHYYTLILSGGDSVLHAWEGHSDSSVGAVFATFDTTAVYDNPALLTNATYLPDPAVTASIGQTGTLSIGLPANGFVGAFKVVVSVTDGLLTTSQTVSVTSTDTAPTLSVQQNDATVGAGSTLDVPHGLFPLSDTITASSVGNQQVTTTASVSSYSQLFSLEQQYRFQGLGYFNAGGAAYVFSAVGDNSFGNPYYLLSTSGALYAYDGSGNYATSFARTPVATLDADVYSDPTLLTNAQPPIDYSQYYSLQQQYQFTGLGYFTAGATVYVFHSSQPGAGVGGYYLLTANGSLYAYDGSGNYATSIANSANLVASLDPGVFVNPSLLLDAEASPSMYPQLQQVEQQLDLQELAGGFYVGLMGNAAKWLYSPIPNSHGQNYYTLVLSAATSQALLFAWDGGSNSVPTDAMPVATLDSSVYYNPALLLDAKAPEAATGVTAAVTPSGPAASPSSGTLAIGAPDSFVGTFQVTVNTTDGALTTTQTFQIASTDTAPVPAAVSNQTASLSHNPLAVALNAADAQGDAVSYTATAESAAYALQQQYQFTGVGLFTAGGVTAYLLLSAVPGGSQGYDLLSSTGGVYAYDGSGSFANTIADSYNLVAQLTPAVYTTPTLLTAATPASPGATLTVTPVNTTASTLSVNVAGVAPGTVFQVIVTASDGAETSRTSFMVTVTS